MRIVVAYKWAGNPQHADVGPDGAVDWQRAPATIGEYDEVAMEVARRLADATGAELVGLTLGPAHVGEARSTKAALSRGPDRLVALADDGYASASTSQTAALLAEAVRRIGEVDLVLTGDSSLDEAAKLTGPTMAGTLGWACLAEVASVSAAQGGDGVEVTRVVDGGTQTLTVPLPAVLACASDAAVPRIPGMKDVLAAAKKPVQVLTCAELPLPPVGLTRLAASRPDTPARRGTTIPGEDPQAAARTLVAALRDAGTLT